MDHTTTRKTASKIKVHPRDPAELLRNVLADLRKEAPSEKRNALIATLERKLSTFARELTANKRPKTHPRSTPTDNPAMFECEINNAISTPDAKADKDTASTKNCSGPDHANSAASSRNESLFSASGISGRGDEWLVLETRSVESVAESCQQSITHQSSLTSGSSNNSSLFELTIDQSVAASHLESVNTACLRMENQSVTACEEQERGRIATSMRAAKGIVSEMDTDLDSDEDIEAEDEEEAQENAEEVRILQAKFNTSKLSMAIQGFRSRARSEKNYAEETIPKKRAQEPFVEQETLEYDQRIFKRNSCYLHETDSGTLTVGIVGFRGDGRAECALVVPFAHTILGMTDDDVKFYSDFEPSPFVRIEGQTLELSLAELLTECEPSQLPGLVYKPQTHGDWQSFAYYYSTRSKIPETTQAVTILELFAGCGGMHQGHGRTGFRTVLAVEKDRSAATTFSTNNPNVGMYIGNVRDFLKYSESRPGVLGKIDHIHASPPCKGYSGANRTGGANDKANNDLSSTFVKAVRIKRPKTACFENVPGMWKRKHMHYLLQIVSDLLRLDYQVRVCTLRASDYGDPQKRPRLFIFASDKETPLPAVPPKTHGPGLGLIPFTAVQDALEPLLNNRTNDMAGMRSSSRPGVNHRLVSDQLAPAIRAKGAQPLHPFQDRCITVREAACLQSFPLSYKFVGTTQSQYQQIGNAVPVRLATAVAHAFRIVHG